MKRPTAPHTGSMSASYRNIRRISVILIGLILTGAPAGCSEPAGFSADPGPKNDNVLRYDVNSPITSLYPAAVKFSGSTSVFPLLYSYLFVPDAEGELQADLAVRWDYDPNKRQWKILLRNDARFHDQRPVTASDVKFSLDVYIAQNRPGLKSTIDEIDASTADLLTLHLKHDDPMILRKLWDIEIVPGHKKDGSDSDMRPIGSGPFKFVYRQGQQRVTLEANAHYYGGRPALDRIEYFFQPDREKAWARLLSGATDIAQEISPQNYRIIHQYRHRFHLNTYTMGYFTILLYNTHDPLFSDPKVRTALTLAIDRDYIIEGILNGLGRIAAGPMGLDSPFHNPEVKPLAFDPVRALELLHQAGWRPDKAGRLHKQGKPFEFTILVFTESHVEKKVARFIQLSLHRLGIKTHLQALDHEEIKASYLQNTGYQAVITELNGAYRAPSTIKNIWSLGDHGKSHAGGFNHPEVNRLMERAFAAANPMDQKELLRELDGLIASLQPGTFLFQKTAVDAMSRRIHLPHPFSMTIEGTTRLRDASINTSFGTLTVNPRPSRRGKKRVGFGLVPRANFLIKREEASRLLAIALQIPF